MILIAYTILLRLRGRRKEFACNDYGACNWLTFYYRGVIVGLKSGIAPAGFRHHHYQPHANCYRVWAMPTEAFEIAKFNANSLSVSSWLDGAKLELERALYSFSRRCCCVYMYRYNIQRWAALYIQKFIKMASRPCTVAPPIVQTITQT